MAFTSVQDNSTVTVDTVKLWLRIDDDDVGSVLDPVLEIALAAAKEEADNYIQDDFDTVPARVELWLLQVVANWWERKGPMIISTQFQDSGSMDWEFNYDDFFSGLKPFRMDPGFA